MENNIDKLQDARTNMSQTLNLYDALMKGEITVKQAMQTGSLTSPDAVDTNMFSTDAMVCSITSYYLFCCYFKIIKNSVKYNSFNLFS